MKIIGILTAGGGTSGPESSRHAGDAALVGVADASSWLNFSLAGNELWRLAILLGIICLTVIVCRIVGHVLNTIAFRLEKDPTTAIAHLIIKSLARPLNLAIMAGGLYVGRLALKFAVAGGESGFSPQAYVIWAQICQAMAAFAVAWFIFRMVDLIEYYLRNWTGKTQSSLDDMLVPMVRKSLRIFIVIISGLFIADNILGMKIGAILAAVGVGGLALGLAAKDTISHFFGSICIFSDKPFQVGDRIRIKGFDGPVEEVGFRSTRLRTLDGHLVTVPNSTIANDVVENIGPRPYIKRVMNLNLSYETTAEQVETALTIIREILEGIPEITTDPELMPRVYFSEFKEWALNIFAIYWVKPPAYWDFMAVNQRINMAIMKALSAAGIRFAIPAQQIYLAPTRGEEPA